MAYDFPNSPSVGTLFAPAGGPTWQWNGTAWTNVSPANLVPEAPVDGQNYVRRNGVWVLAPGTAEAKNRIVNPAMQTSQENGTSSVTTGNYPADQWQMSSPIATVIAAMTIPGAAHPNGTNSVITSVTTAKPSLAAGDFWNISQFVEGIRLKDFRWGSSNAKQIVVQFWCFSAQAGTYTFYIKNGVPDRCYMAPFTVTAASTWQQVTLTIPGDTTGTWATDSTKAMIFGWGLAAGSTYNTGVAGWAAGSGGQQIAGHTNLAQAANNTFYVSSVGLYLDPDATGLAPKWTMPDEAQELAACQRYWRQGPLLTGKYHAANNASLYGSFAPPMRTDPAVTVLNGTNGLNEIGIAVRTITGVNSASGYAGGDMQASVTATGSINNMVNTTPNQRVFVVNARM